MHENSEKALIQASEELTELEKIFIDEYYTNGFNQVKAAQEVKPSSTKKACEEWARLTMNRPRVKEYKKKRSAILSNETGVQNVHILKELLSFAYSDVTAFIGLNKDELKALPADIRRSIASIDTTTKTYLDAKTKQIVKEETIKIKLIDKLKAIDMISKHINFYEADNRSKSGTIDLTSASNEELNTVLSLLSRQHQLNEPQQ